MKASRQLIAAIACTGLIAAACGDDDSDSDAEAPASDETGQSGDTRTPDDTGASDDTATSGDTAMAAADTSDIDPASIEYDVGVDDTTIKVGMITGLTGTFAPVAQAATEAQRVYWGQVNEQGGIGGRQIELVIEDNSYDVQQTVQKYDAIHEEIAIISQIGGSPHLAAVAEQLVDDDLIAIPYTFYSGWADAEIGSNVLEMYSNYCLESMNGVEWLHTNRDVQSVAVVSFAGEYGEDAATGAIAAAEELGLDVVYDGVGEVTAPTAEIPNPDQSTVITKIVDANPDAVWAAINPDSLVSIMQGAINDGYEGLWSGNWPTYEAELLATSAGDVLDQYYVASSFFAAWGTDVPGMADAVGAMTAERPNLPPADAFILGWTQAMATHAVLAQAAANGDMTRAGIVEAAGETTVDFNGLAPSQTWSGEPDDHLVRETYLYDVVADRYDDASLESGKGDLGYELLEGPYTGSVAEGYQWEGPCFTP